MSIVLDRVAVRVQVDGRAGPKTLLEDVSLDLSEQRIGVIGANGSGKSTLLRLLNGLVAPSSGSVLVGGADTVRAVREVRRRVGFVFTDPLSQLVMPTGREDVELSLRRSVRNAAERRRQAEATLDRFGLLPLADQSIYELSGGERQLLALAAVLAVGPEVLVLDEPSTLLDLRNRELLRRTLAGLGQQVILSTHDLELALRHGPGPGGPCRQDCVRRRSGGRRRPLPCAERGVPGIAAGDAAVSPGVAGFGAAVSGHGFLLANYAPGSSVVHRSPLWLKFLLVLGCGMASFLIVDWAVAAGVLALMCGVFLLSGAGAGRLWRAVRPVLPVLAAIGLFQWWQLGGPTAARIVLNVLVCVVAASILTATTPVQALLDGVASLARPFRRFGADPERFALTIAIMLRSIPFIAGAYSDVRDSARARGLERNPRALVLPVFITTVAFARQTGEALAARGLGEAEDRDG